MLMGMCFHKSDIYQSTVAPNCFESNINSWCPDFFQKPFCLVSGMKLTLSDVKSLLPDKSYIQVWYRTCSCHFKCIFFKDFCTDTFVIWMLYECLKQNVSQRIIFTLKTHLFTINASIKEHVFWPKHIMLFNTNSLEQFTHLFEIIKYF